MQLTNKTNLTEGPIGQKITAFAIPIFFGHLFQQFYNTADSIIVGNFLGSDALAAVSSSGSIIFLLIGFMHGVAIGAGVVIARYYGARQYSELKKAIYTTVVLGVLAGLFLTAFGVWFTPKLLVWMKTPAEVLPQSTLYFRIYFCGSLAFVLYNFFVGILQAVGDSRHPLYYLIGSSIINIILDLYFIAVLHKGIGSAALATIISQFISAAFCFHRLVRKSPEEYRIVFREIRLDFPMLRQIIANGLPTGIQNSVINIANVVVQSNINSFGRMAVAGCGAYQRIEGFGFLPITSFSMALTTFVSQNLGAGKYDRVKKGGFFGILCGVITAQLVGIYIYYNIPVLISFFNSDPAVIAFGTRHARIVTRFYFLLAFSHCISGYLRGVGKSVVPMVVMLSFWCIFRVAYITIITHFIPDISAVLWAYPITWSLSSLAFAIYYLIVKPGKAP